MDVRLALVCAGRPTDGSARTRRSTARGGPDPEGVRGTGKLYKDRYKLERFGTGFMRLALRTNTPIVPHAFIGGEEAMPTIYHAKTLAKIIGAPYVPIPVHLIPIPLPVPCDLHFGEPMTFDGDGTESDEVIEGYVAQVKVRIAELIEVGLRGRGRKLPSTSGVSDDGDAE